MTLDDYSPIVGEKAVAQLRELGKSLNGKKVLHINSTFVGGGVAELLKSITRIMEGAGVPTEWKVINGDQEFFDVTKAFHNALQGSKITITKKMTDKYEEINKLNAETMDLDRDFVFIHDPQPAPLVAKREKDSGWVWRCHIDISNPDKALWEYLSNYVNRYDAAVVHVPEYSKRDLKIPQHIIPPSIDPLAEKNMDLPESYVESVLRKYDLDPDLPIVTQVSRFDKLKDPLGVMESYELAKKGIETVDFRHLFDEDKFAFDVFKTVRNRIFFQLLLVGGSANDDPEGERFYSEVFRKAITDKNVHVLMLPPDAHREINAIQRGSTIIIQKSIKEGFGLTVTEGMWKGKPVIGGKTGGIVHQIQDWRTGFLVSSPTEAAERMLFLLRNPLIAKRMGREAKEHVKKNFLVTRHASDYLNMLKGLKATE